MFLLFIIGELFIVLYIRFSVELGVSFLFFKCLILFFCEESDGLVILLRLVEFLS